MKGNDIVLEGITKSFDGSTEAVRNVDLAIEPGEFLVLVGPSGCGKSTLLRMIAGLEDVTKGLIRIGGRDVTHLPARSRDVAMVFQNYALYPHMSVYKNLGYGLRVRNVPKQEIDARVRLVAHLLGLGDLLERRPSQLSGGQRQRVAMGRAIVREPVAYLMDEPLSNLDAKLRVTMRAELAAIHARLATTTVYVTHDQVEAMTLGQRVTVMSDGAVQQVATPRELYAYPSTIFVAGFIGSPPMNFFEAEVTGDRVRFAGIEAPISRARKPRRQGDVILGVRPSAFEDAAHALRNLPKVEVDVLVLEELGNETHVVFSLPAARPVETTLAVIAGAASEDSDEKLFTATVNPRTCAMRGAPMTLAIDPEGFHFFDPESGENIGPAHRITSSGQVGSGADSADLAVSGAADSEARATW